MELTQYCGEKVNIIATNGRFFSGIVDDYIFPEDNESGLESIILKTKDSFYEFTSEDIEKIDII